MRGLDAVGDSYFLSLKFQTGASVSVVVTWDTGWRGSYFLSRAASPLTRRVWSCSSSPNLCGCPRFSVPYLFDPTHFSPTGFWLSLTWGAMARDVWQFVWIFETTVPRISFLSHMEMLRWWSPADKSQVKSRKLLCINFTCQIRTHRLRLTLLLPRGGLFFHEIHFPRGTLWWIIVPLKSRVCKTVWNSLPSTYRRRTYFFFAGKESLHSGRLTSV